MYFCHYEYQVDDFRKKESWRESDYVEFKTNVIPTDEEIKAKIIFEWKRKGIKNRTIMNIYHPEKIY